MCIWPLVQSCGWELGGMWEKSQNLTYSQCVLDSFSVVLAPFQTESKTLKADRVLKGLFPLTLKRGLSLPYKLATVTKRYFHSKQPSRKAAKNVCDCRGAAKRVLNKRRRGVSEGKQWQENPMTLSLLCLGHAAHRGLWTCLPYICLQCCPCDWLSTGQDKYTFVSLGYEQERMRQKYPVSFPAHLSYSH